MADRAYAVLSAIGPDHPGLVATLTSAIVGVGANVEDSRMAVLGSSFGIMMLLSGDIAAIEQLRADGDALERRTGLRVHLEPTTSPLAAAGIQRYEIEVESADREGIVHAIAAALVELGGNIVDLTSALYPAPVSAAPLFRLNLTADVPQAVGLVRLQQRFDALAAAEDLDCRVREAE